MKELNEAISWIAKARPRRIVALTGSGISAESGIPTFRGADGLWESFRAEDLATPEAFARDPELVWRWYEWRRTLIREAQPNDAHRALAQLEALSGIATSIVTQNVDGLHARGGSRDVVELHGNIMEARCTKERSVFDFFAAASSIPPRCNCGAMLRPNVVWFGEALPPAAWQRAVELVEESDLILIIGTSGLVYPAAGLSGYQREGRTIEINPAATPLSASADFVLPMKATEAVPAIVEAIEGAAR